MTERMVDVMDKTVLHTYPMSLSASNPSVGVSSPVRDTDYEKAALSAAKTAKLQCDHPRGPSTRSFGTTRTSTLRCPQQLYRNRSWTSGTSPLPASTRACGSALRDRRHEPHVRRRST
jgi:hypothetical protein